MTPLKSMQTKLTWPIVLASVILIAVIATFGFTRKDQPRYFTARVERGDVRDVVDSTGTINAVTTGGVGVQVAGAVARLGVDFNAGGRRGEESAEIDAAWCQGGLV